MPDINKIDIDKKSKLFLTFIRNSQKLHRKTLLILLSVSRFMERQQYWF